MINPIFRSESEIVDLEDQERNILGSFKISPMSDEIYFISQLRGRKILNNMNMNVLLSIRTRYPDANTLMFTMQDDLITKIESITGIPIVRIRETKISGKKAFLSEIRMSNG